MRLGDTGRAIIIHDDQILLMERWRDDSHYFSIPGGHVEGDETPEQAAVREVAEETSVAIELGRLVFTMKVGDSNHHIFLATYLSGEPHLPDDADEAGYGDNNRFAPRWVPITDLATVPLIYWEPLRLPLLQALAQGFPETPEVVLVGKPS